MGFKIRLEIDPNFENEVIIKAPVVNEEVLRLQSLLAENSSSCEMEFHLGGMDFFIKLKDILFFESDGNKTAAHTSDRMFYTDKKLYELEQILPREFIRISKSAIINSRKVSSLRRELTGIAEATFHSSAKKIYISRNYYKAFRETINEMRLKP